MTESCRTPALAVEICLAVDSPFPFLRELQTCVQAGVSRVELCRQLAEAGLTQATACVRRARRCWGAGPGLLAMARPRAGDFDYSLPERQLLERDVVALARSGADGVVVGVLRRGRLHHPALRSISRVASDWNLTLTFHRAFDALHEPLDAVDELVELGFQRILSSGTPWLGGRSAAAGLEPLAALRERINGRLELVVAGGVDAAFVPGLRRALKPTTGELSLHAWSGVRRAGKLDPRRLRELMQAARG